MWRKHNPNPCRTETEDCVIRAIATAIGRRWRDIHRELCDLSRNVCSMPSVNWVWGLYLEQRGWRRYPTDGTVRMFADEHPRGVYILGTGSHAVAVMDGDWWDAWDSGDEQPVYYFVRTERG